jgi:nucleoside-diphosphate-sugar epimerase
MEEMLAVLSNYGITQNADEVAITLWGSGKVFREFMHAEDMAAACVLVIENFTHRMPRVSVPGSSTSAPEPTSQSWN